MKTKASLTTLKVETNTFTCHARIWLICPLLHALSWWKQLIRLHYMYMFLRMQIQCRGSVVDKMKTEPAMISFIIIMSLSASRRIRSTHSQSQHSLFRAAALATFQLFHPALFLSLSTVLLQVVFGLPLILRPSGVHPKAVKQSFSPSLLSTWPNQFHLLRCTSQLISLIPDI